MPVRSTLVAAAAAIASTIAAAPAFAADFDQTQLNQQDRIRHGVRSGALTRVEAARLEDEQDRIGRMIRRARIDGRVDADERASIGRAQDVASRHIFAEKHDVEARPHRWGHRWSRWSRWNRWN